MEEQNYRELIEEVKKTRSLIALVFAALGTEIPVDTKIRILGYGGLRQSEIAEVLGINQSTVSKHLGKTKV